jgi:hypothetical protein
MAVAAVPCALLAMLYAKNLLLFGTIVPGSDAFGGTNLARLATRLLPSNKIQELIAQGKISPWILTTDIYQIDKSPISRNVPDPPKTGIPVLDDRYKSTGALNWNSAWFGEVGKLYRKDALTVLRMYPEFYGASVVENLRTLFLPATDNWPFDGRQVTDNLRLVSQPLAVYVLLTTGQSTDPYRVKARRPWFSYLVFPGLLAFGLWMLFKQRSVWNQPSNLVLMFMLFNIIYLSAAAVLLSDSDQNRYRDEVSAFFAVLFGLALTAGWRKLRPARSAPKRIRVSRPSRQAAPGSATKR